MKAELILHDKVQESDGGIIETKVWAVPVTKEKPHGYRYSLVYIRNGKRMLCYDNHTGKGDHKHYCNNEEPYKFTTIDKLFTDFYKDLRRLKSHEG